MFSLLYFSSRIMKFTPTISSYPKILPTQYLPTFCVSQLQLKVHLLGAFTHQTTLHLNIKLFDLSLLTNLAWVSNSAHHPHFISYLFCIKSSECFHIKYDKELKHLSPNNTNTHMRKKKRRYFEKLINADYLPL